MFYQPDLKNHGLPFSPFKALVVPRPIGWISSRSAEGVDNLAPYSFFNAIGEAQIAFSAAIGKDSARNIAETGAFIVNIVSGDLFESMNASSASVGAEVDEFALAGLEKVPGQLVQVPRVAQARAALECRHVETLALKDRHGRPTGHELVIGDVVGIYIDDQVIDSRGRVDVARLKPLSRLGYDEYAVVEQTFSARRPTG